MKVISGGQTGADRGGLDAAIELGFEHGGWCPRGRRAEDGVIPPRYQLVETSSVDYRRRTRLNVKAADVTVIFIGTPQLTGGSKLTNDLCHEHVKPTMIKQLACALAFLLPAVANAQPTSPPYRNPGS